ncbi:DUF2809 domain-containing protein [Microbacteriaceae bacterium 4G12]
MIYKRNRLVYGTLLLSVMACGLLSRRTAYVLPHFVNTYLGDALWALMIFIGFGFILKTAKTRSVAFIALSFCYLIECSQLYHATWIDTIRNTTLGGLILGYGFLWSDLLAYSIGIGAGVLMELFVIIRKQNKEKITNV